MLIEISLKYFNKVYDILNKDGLVIISTPNVDHVNQLWKQDVKHIQQYPGEDIYTILGMIGFAGEINVFKINLRNSRLTLKKALQEQARIVANKILGTDYTHGIVLYAYKNE